MYITTEKKFEVGLNELKRAVRVPLNARVVSVEVIRYSDTSEPSQLTIKVRMPGKQRGFTK